MSRLTTQQARLRLVGAQHYFHFLQAPITASMRVDLCKSHKNVKRTMNGADNKNLCREGAGVAEFDVRHESFVNYPNL